MRKRFKLLFHSNESHFDGRENISNEMSASLQRRWFVLVHAFGRSKHYIYFHWIEKQSQILQMMPECACMDTQKHLLRSKRNTQHTRMDRFVAVIYASESVKHRKRCNIFQMRGKWRTEPKLRAVVWEKSALIRRWREHYIHLAASLGLCHPFSVILDCILLNSYVRLRNHIRYCDPMVTINKFA